jgi:hypothetical protein
VATLLQNRSLPAYIRPEMDDFLMRPNKSLLAGCRILVVVHSALHAFQVSDARSKYDFYPKIIDPAKTRMLTYEVLGTIEKIFTQINITTASECRHQRVKAQ